MVKLSDDEIRGKILHKLSRMRKFGGAHTSERDAIKGFPAHMIKRAKKILEEMIREELLVMKPTAYGKHISINLAKRNEVEQLIKLFLEKKYTKA